MRCVKDGLPIWMDADQAVWRHYEGQGCSDPTPTQHPSCQEEYVRQGLEAARRALDGD